MILRSAIKRIVDELKKECEIDEFLFYDGCKASELVAIRRIIAYIIINNSSTTTANSIASHFKVTPTAICQGNMIVTKKLKEKTDLIFIQLYDKIYNIMQSQKLV